jgi:4-hydroxybenzoate polyprenyltransferase
MKSLRALIITMRPVQWLKNVFVFAALIFDRQLFSSPALLRTICGFVLFCLLSSVVYIFNDIADIEADRQHPEKKSRPLAAGDLSIANARTFGIVLLGLVFPLAYWLSPSFALVALVYFLANLAYSLWLKHIPLLDVLLLAAGYVLMVMGGVVLIQVERFSPWLYVVTTMGALFVGFAKRRGELAMLAGEANTTRPVLGGYTIQILDQLITIATSTTLIAYSLYTFSAPNLPANHSMMLTIPFVIYGIFRYLYLVAVEKKGGAPEVVVLSDRPFQVAVILWGAMIFLIFYVFR